MPRPIMALALMGCAAAFSGVAPSDDFAVGALSIVSADSGGRVVAASSELRERGKVRPEWAKENVIDGKRVEGLVPAGSYGWASEVAPSPRAPQWLTFAFAQDRPRLVGAVRIDPRSNDPQAIGRWIKGFRVEVSVTTAEGPWESVGDFSVIDVPSPQAFRLAVPTLTKYLRLVITSNQGSNARVSFGELEVFEALVGDDQLTRVIGALEGQLRTLKELAAARGASAVAFSAEAPPYADSLIAAARGGSVEAVSSEALPDSRPGGVPGEPLPQWRATNLIDGAVAAADSDAAGGSYGWSSDAAPVPDRPEWVILRVPGETPQLIDAALFDTHTRDPWGMMRGARMVEIAVSISGADGPWRKVGQWELAFEPAARVVHFPPVEARFVRLNVLSNYDSDRYVELGEFGVYRLGDGRDSLGGIAACLDNIVTDLKLYREISALSPGLGGP